VDGPTEQPVWKGWIKVNLKSTLQLPIAYICLLSLHRLCCAQPQDPLADRALQEFREKNYAAAERDFREITHRDPSNIYAQFYLGQTLFKEEQYAAAANTFQKAHDLEKAGNVLSVVQRRILTDQLVMAYGINGDLKKAHTLLDDAIKQDPEYPLNYYNLACAFAEDGDKAKLLVNLALAFQHKNNALSGEQMPDPRADSSFQKFVRDPDFAKLMRDLGYK